MSFNALKRLFGFGSDSDPDQDELLADDADAPASAASDSKHKPAEKPADPPAFDHDIAQRIFGSVIQIFNESLPKFVADSVDPKVQAELIRKALDQDIQKYLDSLSETARQYCEQQWKQTRTALEDEIAAAKAKSAEVQRKSEEFQQRQLSADRQRRALSDRVHDLEAQLTKLEAEREQLDLEKRSLVNRLRVASVQGASDVPAEALADTAEVEKLKQTIAEMQSGIDSLKEQNRVANEMLEDQRKRLAEAKKELDEARAQLAAKEKELAETNEALTQFNEVVPQMQKVDELLSAKEEKIKQLRKTISARDNEITALRKTISDNIRAQAQREKELQQEIDKLQGAAPKPATLMTIDEPIDEEPTPQISEEELSAIEQSFESGEWFTNSKPVETPPVRPDDSDFGYQEPKRKKNQPDPNQLSLFFE
ncbi:MAG: hypothetical protein ACI4AM_08420 [Muribaculaceae bacterium]